MTETAATLARTAPSPPLSPYKGLTPFTEKDAAFFFGRESEREIIAANLLAARLTILYGPSGVGKSSVLFAGVVGDLRRRARENSEDDGSPGFAVVVVRSWRDIRSRRSALRRAHPASRCSDVTTSPIRRPGRRSPTCSTTGPPRSRASCSSSSTSSRSTSSTTSTSGPGLPRRGAPAGRQPARPAGERPDLDPRGRAREARPPSRAGSRTCSPTSCASTGSTGGRRARAILGPIEELNRRSGDVSYEVEPALVDAVLAEVAAGGSSSGLSGRGVVDGAEESGRVEAPTSSSCSSASGRWRRKRGRGRSGSRRYAGSAAPSGSSKITSSGRSAGSLRPRRISPHASSATS